MYGLVDVAALENLTSAITIAINANTNIANRRSAVALAFSPKITIVLGGYGVPFLTLKPRSNIGNRSNFLFSFLPKGR